MLVSGAITNALAAHPRRAFACVRFYQNDTEVSAYQTSAVGGLTLARPVVVTQDGACPPAYLDAGKHHTVRVFDSSGAEINRLEVGKKVAEIPPEPEI